MTLIKSISGFRGTVGGKQNENLTPVDIVKFSAAFACFIKEEQKDKEQITIVIGRDARVSGEMVSLLVCGTLIAMGVKVINTGLSTTPTVEMAVLEHQADGGIILTASHNPVQWNALKLLNANGEFINAEEGKRVLMLAEGDFEFAEVGKLGFCIEDQTSVDKHINKILALPLVDIEAIKKANFKIAFDSVCSTGGFVLNKLLSALGIQNIVALNTEPTGIFPHNPEPLPENITEICEAVMKNHCDAGFVVDPDVDRLAIVCENGVPFVEEYTLVAVADYILSNEKGNTVSNLSSSLALRDITEAKGCKYSAAAVGEVNVVAKMKETNAIIGGEGNGGIIYPALHYGRDALVGIALFLTYLAKRKIKCSELKATYPQYVISKNKIELTPEIDVDNVLQQIATKYKDNEISTIDGVKIYFNKSWVHLRKSNTEPIIRIYSESSNAAEADALAKQIIEDLRKDCNF
ncbi:MAG: phosphoglucosamine mutase [Bacteroidales bacterium]|jgi:phosphomannomutase|nr:phosphoglucosamine mutase [Bacteroidales bacterium]